MRTSACGALFLAACSRSPTGAPGPLSAPYDAVSHYNDLHPEPPVPDRGPAREVLADLIAAQPFEPEDFATHEQDLALLRDDSPIATVRITWSTARVGDRSLVMRAQIRSLWFAEGWSCTAPPLAHQELAGDHPFIDRIDATIDCAWQSGRRSATSQRSFSLNADAHGKLSMPSDNDELRVVASR
jgi:hypothetical protein